MCVLGDGTGPRNLRVCRPLCPTSVCPLLSLGAGVCSEESRLQARQHQLRRQGLWWLTGVVCLGAGGAGLGGGLVVVGPRLQ